MFTLFGSFVTLYSSSTPASIRAAYAPSLESTDFSAVTATFLGARSFAINHALSFSRIHCVGLYAFFQRYSTSASARSAKSNSIFWRYLVFWLGCDSSPLGTRGEIEALSRDRK